MPVSDPDQSTHLPAKPSGNAAGTADQSRRDESDDPDRTRDGSGSRPVELSQTVALGPSIPGYEIEGVLGRGGMGVVYKARHLTLKRTVALKMVLSGAHAGSHELARFRIEAEAVARLQHPNIVPVYEVGEAGGHPYCVLEFVEGGTLARKIGGQPLPADEAARLIEALARGMQLAHSRNVVHRDLKPANVLLALDGTPRITDFGLARRMDTDSGETHAGMVMGTPSYMAPEQASGYTHAAGPAADVYALGAILYECLTGRPPFKGATTVETLDLVRTQEPVPPSRVQSGVPADLETICQKCLRKEPERRYASAAELADDLGRYQRGEPILARPVGHPERAWKWVKRNPGRAAAAVAAVAVLVGAGIAANAVSKRRQEDRIAAEKQRADDRIEAEKTLANERVTAAKRIAEEQADRKLEQERAKDRLAREEDRAEWRLTRTWLGALAEAPVPFLNDGEVEAIIALAATGNDRVEYRFVTEALDDPQGRRKLRTRAPFAFQAVAGSEEAKRSKVEQLLTDRLEQLDPSDASRTDVALAAAHLGGLSPGAATKVAEVLMRALAKTTDLVALERLAESLTLVAGRLEPKEAAAVLTRAVTGANGPGGLRAPAAALRVLAVGVSAAAARLPAEEGARVSGVVASRLTKAMSDTNDALDLRPLALGLAAVAPGLKPADAAKSAAVLKELKGRPMRNSPGATAYLGLGLGAVTNRQETKQTGRLFAESAAALAGANEPELRNFMFEDLSEWATRLEAEDAAKAAAALIQAVVEANDSFRRDALRLNLSTVLARLDPKAATEAAAALAKALTREGISVFDVAPLGLTLAAVVPRLEPDEAAKVAASITQALTESNDPMKSEVLTLVLATTAARLKPTDAAKPAAVIVQALSKSNNPSAHHELVQGLSAVVARLEPAEAARIAADVAAQIKRAGANMDFNAVMCLGRCLPAVAPHMKPEEAVETVAALKRVLAVVKDGPNAIQPLAEGLAAVAVRVEPKERARLLGEAVAVLDRAIGAANTGYPMALPTLARSLSAVAARMEPKEEARVLGEVAKRLQAVPGTTDQDRDAFRYRLQALAVLGPRLDARSAAGAAGAVMQALAKDGGAKKEPAGAALLTTERPVTPAQVLSALLGSGQRAEGTETNRLSDQELVELLKRPFCAGAARRAVLDELQRRYKRQFADQWDFARFATEQKLGLDLARPRPPAPRAVGQ